MSNIQQYISYDKVPCLQYQLNLSNPSIDPSNIKIPKKVSEYLIVDNFLSEYNTELEKKLVMLNLLLIDSTPKENSTNLIDSGTVFRIMREGKLERDLLTELFNHLQINKSDKSEVLSIIDLVSNIQNRLELLDNIGEGEDLISKIESLINDILPIKPIPASKINNLFINGTDS